jgi:hypothetical protein
MRRIQIPTIAKRLENGSAANFSLSLHGSYRSVVHREDLAREVRALQFATGVMPAGNRQHWLRQKNHICSGAAHEPGKTATVCAVSRLMLHAPPTKARLRSRVICRIVLSVKYCMAFLKNILQDRPRVIE